MFITRVSEVKPAGLIGKTTYEKHVAVAFYFNNFHVLLIHIIVVLNVCRDFVSPGFIPQMHYMHSDVSLSVWHVVTS